MDESMKLLEYKIRQAYRLHRYKRLSRKEPWKVECPRHNNKQFAFLIGTCVNGNLGDQAISYCSIRFIKEVCRLPLVEVNVNQYWHQRGELKKIIKKDDIIFIQGGGNIGDEYMGAEFCRRDLLSLFPDNTIISLPQTVSFSSTRTGVYEKRLSQSIYAKHKNHIIFARERYSFDFLKKTFLNSSIYLIPDIVLLYSDYSIRKEPNRTALLCLRSDCEGIFCAEDRKKIYRSIVDRFENIRFTDTFVDCVNIDDRKSMIEKKLSEFASAELVITDRLHGMVLASYISYLCAITSSIAELI